MIPKYTEVGSDFVQPNPSLPYWIYGGASPTSVSVSVMAVLLPINSPDADDPDHVVHYSWVVHRGRTLRSMGVFTVQPPIGVPPRQLLDLTSSFQPKKYYLCAGSLMLGSVPNHASSALATLHKSINALKTETATLKSQLREKNDALALRKPQHWSTIAAKAQAREIALSAEQEHIDTARQALVAEQLLLSQRSEQMARDFQGRKAAIEKACADKCLFYELRYNRQVEENEKLKRYTKDSIRKGIADWLTKHGHKWHDGQAA